MKRPSTRWSLPLLLSAAGRAGWNGLNHADTRAATVILHALVDLLDHRTGQGLVTIPQIADAAPYGERWTRRTLSFLEDAGLIEWNRGGIIHGKPQPSWVRIVKTALVEVIENGRERMRTILAARRARTEARIRGLKRLTVRPRSRNRRSAHAALAAAPTTPRGEVPTEPRPESDQNMGTYDPYSDRDCPEPGHEGFRAGYQASGNPWCPLCRRAGKRRPPEPKQDALIPATPAMTARHRANVIDLNTAKARHGR